MTMTEENMVRAECERRRWFMALAFGVDEPGVALLAPPAPAAGDVLP